VSTKTRPPPRCNGALLIDQYRVMEERVGADVVRRAIASLPADQREGYESATSVSWVRVGTADAVLSAVAREAGIDPLHFQAEVARVGVEKTLGGV
jgi:hypothetical protein